MYYNKRLSCNEVGNFLGSSGKYAGDGSSGFWGFVLRWRLAREALSAMVESGAAIMLR